MFHRDTRGCSSLSRQKKLENNIRMYLSLFLILSVSYSWVTEINESQTYADYFCIFLRRSLQKSWSQVQLPWPGSGLLRNRIGKQISVPRSRGLLFVCLFSFNILNLTSDVLPSSMSPGVLMYMSYQFTYRKDILYFGISSFQNKNRMNLFYISATSPRSFYFHSSKIHFSSSHEQEGNSLSSTDVDQEKHLSLSASNEKGWNLVIRQHELL